MSNPDGPFLEEPVMCECCSGWIELNACHFCDECKQGHCSNCHHDNQHGLCTTCGNIRDREEYEGGERVAEGCIGCADEGDSYGGYCAGCADIKYGEEE